MRRLALTVGVAAAVVALAPPSSADDKVQAHSNGSDDVVVHGQQTIPGDGPSGTDGTGPDGSDTFTSYEEDVCADPDEVLVERFQRAGFDNPWQLASTGCADTATVPARPILTPDMVLEAVRTIGLPDSTFEVPSETLVNYDTVVYTETTTFTRTVNLLDYTIDVRARPSQFTWHFGDGTTAATTTAGRPYPAKDITHTWTDAHRAFHPRVDTTYTVAYRVDGGPWLDLSDTITVQGPEGNVRIREATGMLAEMN